MGGPVAGRTPLDRECDALLEQVRARCPHLVPARPLPAGATGEPVPVNGQQVTAILTAALRQAASLDATGRLPANDASLPGVVIWEDGTCALAVELAAVRTQTEEGQVIFTVPVRCDQLPQQRGVVSVSFTVGTPNRPTGLIAATPRRPTGPDLVVGRWGDALVALCWRALLDAAAGIAAATGTDTDGSGLIPAALTCTHAGLEVLPQARHPFDRVPVVRAVRPQ
jgi:hypothetical protein